MQIMPLIIAGTGLLMAGSAVYLGEALLNPTVTTAAPAQSAPAAPEQIVLIAAATEIPFGEPILRENLVPQTWPAGLAPEGAFASATMLLGPNGTPPRKATQTIRAGDVILNENVSEFGATVTMGSSLAPGTRAVAISVNTETAVGGFVSPGDRVDVVLTEGAGENLRVGTILHDIRVLAVDQDTNSRGARDARTVTVEVSPRDSERLVLAQRVGQLSLTLRNGDGAMTSDDQSGITISDLWGDPEPEAEPEIIVIEAEPVVETADPSTVIRVRRGIGAQEEVVFGQ